MLVFVLTRKKKLILFILEMPNTTTSSEKLAVSPPVPSKTLVFMVENAILKRCKDNATPDFVKLRHPRSGTEAIFLFASDNSIVHEVFSFSENRSWFINDFVTENGNVFFSTPIDPLFLILPYLTKSKEEGKVIPVEDLLIDNMFPETCRLLKSSTIDNLNLVADRKGPEDLNAWMYNEEKTLRWLSEKVRRVAEILINKKIAFGNYETSKNFVNVDINKSVMPKNVKSCLSDGKINLKKAQELVSEYLTEDLNIKLISHLGLSDVFLKSTSKNKRKSSVVVEQDGNKKMKMIDEPFKGSKAEKSKIVSPKKKLEIPPISKSKSILCFFKKK